MPGPMIASPARYSVLSAAVLGGLGWLALQGAGLGLLPALLLGPLVAWPSWLALAYAAAVRKAQARAVLREGEAPWWGPFLGGALLRQAAAVPLALLAAWSVGWWLVAEGTGGLLWVAAAAALLYPAARLVARQTRALRPYARLRPVLVAAPPIAALALTAAWAVLVGLEAMGEGTLAESVAAQPRYEGSSALMAWAVDAMAVLNGGRAWGLAWAEGRVGWLATLWRLGAAFAQFWLIAGAFAAFLLPAGEARRILRASDADEAPPAGAGRAALAGFLLALLGGAFVAAAAEGEAWATQGRAPRALAEAPGLPSPVGGGGGGEGPRLASAADRAPGRAAPRLPAPTAMRLLIEAERLGDLACPAGTIAGVTRLDERLRAVLSAQRAAVEAAARQGFGAMRANVGGYLDWYYSLPAEYARTGHLLVGDAEEYLAGQFRRHLEAGAPMAPLLEAAEGMAGNAGMIAEWRAGREALLGACAEALPPPDDGVLVTLAEAPAALLTAGPSVEALDLRGRLGGAGAAGAAGGLAGALVGKAAGKLVAKEAFGLAAGALGKLALGKAAGWAGGAAAGAGGGALAGSVVPGLGTAAGAAVGGVLGGIGAWIATDYVLLGLEEALSRESFEAEIRAAIDEAEAEFLASLAP